MLFNTNDSSTLIGSIVQTRQNKYDAAAYQRALNIANATPDHQTFLNAKFDTAKDMSDEVKLNLIDIQKQIKDGTITMEQGLTKVNGLMNNSVEQGSKLGSIFTNIGKTLINGIVSAGIGLLISTVIQGISDIIDELIVTRKEAESLSKTFDDVFSSNSSSQARSIKELSEIEDEYKELSKGVNALGENVSLTDAEFERYNQITQTIANNMPDLVKGYTDQGTAIIDLKDNVKSLTEAYKENQQVAAQELYEQKDENGKHTVIQGVYENAKQHMADAYYGVMDDDHTRYAEEMGYNRQIAVNIDEQIAARKKLAEASQEELIKIFKGNASYEKELLLNEYQYTLDDIENKYDEINAKFKTDSTKFENILQNDATRIAQAGLTNARAYGGYYTSLATEKQKYVDAVINSLDFDFMKEHNLFNETNMNNYVGEVIDAFNSLSPEKFEDLQIAVNLTTEWNNDELTYDEYLQKIQALNELLNALFPENQEIIKAVKILFDVPEEEDLAKNQDVFVNRVAEKRISPNGKIYGVPPEIVEKMKAQGNEVADSWYDSLNKSEREFVDNVSDEDLAEAAKFESTEQFDEWLEKLKANADENLKLEPTASDAVDSMNDAKSAITSLEGLYKQTVTKAVQEGFATGFADPATLTSIRSAFSEFSKDLENKGDKQGAETINAALKDFETTLVEFPNDADKAQAAMNKLITAYIDQTDIIKNLTEENAEWSIAQLKAMGITNAEEVVMSRLNKQVKATMKAISALAKEYQNYNDVLNNANSTEEEKSAAMGSLVGATKEALTVRDKNGEALKGNYNNFLDNVNEGFVQAHLADVQAMAEGDIEALNRVRLAAAEGAVLEVTTNVPTEAAEAQIAGLMDMCAQADAMQIEPGATINDNAFYTALNAMIKSAGLTAEQVNAAFGSMGYSVQFKEHKYATQLVKSNNFGSLPTSVQNQIKGMSMEYNIPEVEFIAKKGSSGAGVGAQYKPKTGGTGNGGGNGGGNNGSSNKSDNDKLAEETAETYDWIAVAIQRLDEEIARLDKQVNNTFKTWTDRNSTLRKEIEKVTEEIEAQKLAVKEYERNVELVSGSGQQLTEGQNKKVKQAQDIWATGDLQKSIQDNVSKYTKGKGKKKKADSKKIKQAVKDAMKKATGSAVGNVYLQDAITEAVNIKISKKKKKKQKIAKVTTSLDNNKPKKSDYDGNTKQYKADLKAYKEAQKQWATGTYQQKIREGTMTGTDIEQIKNKYLKEAINLYKEEYQKVVDVGDAIEDNKIKISEEYKELFENVTKEYDEMIAYIQNNADVVDKRIGLVEEMSYFVDARLYKNLIQSYSKIADDTQKKLDAQIKQFNEGVEKGALAPESEAWYDELSAIQATNSALVEAKTNVAKYNNEIKKGQWERVKFLGERLQRFKEEGDWIKELLSYKDLYDDQGRYNNRGWATSAIIGEQFEYAKSEAQRHKGLIEDFYKGVNSFAEHKYDPYSQDDIAEMDELNDAYRENISLIKEMAEANKDLVSESINKHLESLKKLIDEYNNSLSAAKDLYDFQKNVQSQTDNLNSIQRQLQAYGGDDSEEGRKRRQELRKQLQDAEQQLQETEWDRYISQTGKMLDNMYTDYEDFLNARLDDILVLMSDEIAATNDQKKAISEGLKETQNAFGADFKNWGRLVEGNFTTISSAITDALDNVKASTDEITNPKDAKNPLYGLLGFSKDVWVDKDGKTALRISDFNQELENARKQEEEAKAQAEAARQAEEAAKAEKARQDELQRQREANGGLTNDEVNNQLTNYKIYKEESEKALPILEADLAKYEEERSRMLQDFELLKKKKDKAALQKKIDAKTASINDILSTIDNQKNMIDYYEDMIINLEKLKKANGFAVGSRNIPKKQMAWTQEDGTELIFRSSDGAMLTPLNQGDMVFTAQMTQRLWELASGMIPNSLGGQKLPNISSNNNNTINNNNEIVISLPNVNDYESFKQELQNDSRFEKFIQEVTIGQAMGNNSLSKRKY